MMSVNKLGGIQPLNNVQNTKRTNATASSPVVADSIGVSDEAKEAAKVYYMNQVAAETPDTRADLVAALKEKIKDPNFLSPAVINATAERIMASYGL